MSIICLLQPTMHRFYLGDKNRHNLQILILRFPQDQMLNLARKFVTFVYVSANFLELASMLLVLLVSFGFCNYVNLYYISSLCSKFHSAAIILFLSPVSTESQLNELCAQSSGRRTR